MLNAYLQVHTISIVFLGDFNPVIIQPFWLALKGLIREQEATTAKVEVLHPELVRFNLDWANIEITKDRFAITSSNEYSFEPVRDLSVSVFKILKETPISAMGINHQLHYSLGEQRYFDFGNKLVPLSNWDSFLKKPKVLVLEISESPRNDGKAGSYKIKIQPSDIVKPYGISLLCNDHYALEKEQTGRNLEMVKILEANWGASLQRAKNNAEEIWKKVTE